MVGGLLGTAHSTEAGSFPLVMGQVRRLRLVSQELHCETRRRQDMLVAVRGSMILTDVARTPERFPPPAGPGRRTTGVLIDLAV